MKKNNDWKDRLGVVYSTKSDFNYQKETLNEVETLPPQQQNLQVIIDKKNRKGKIATLIAGFIGTEKDLKELEKKIKTKCGVGGSSKSREIIIQGNNKEKILNFLIEQGYNAKK